MINEPKDKQPEKTEEQAAYDAYQTAVRELAAAEVGYQAAQEKFQKALQALNRFALT